jgi:hypothetical protein
MYYLIGSKCLTWELKKIVEGKSENKFITAISDWIGHQSYDK